MNSVFLPLRSTCWHEHVYSLYMGSENGKVYLYVWFLKILIFLFPLGWPFFLFHVSPGMPMTIFFWGEKWIRNHLILDIFVDMSYLRCGRSYQLWAGWHGPPRTRAFRWTWWSNGFWWRSPIQEVNHPAFVLYNSASMIARCYMFTKINTRLFNLFYFWKLAHLTICKHLFKLTNNVVLFSF